MFHLLRKGFVIDNLNIQESLCFSLKFSSHHRHPPAISREANTPSNLRVETLHLQERLHEIEWQKQVAKDPEILQ